MNVGAPSMDIDISGFLTYRYITPYWNVQVRHESFTSLFQALENIHYDSKNMGIILYVLLWVQSLNNINKGS